MPKIEIEVNLTDANGQDTNLFVISQDMGLDMIKKMYEAISKIFGGVF